METEMFTRVLNEVSKNLARKLDYLYCPSDACCVVGKRESLELLQSHVKMEHGEQDNLEVNTSEYSLSQKERKKSELEKSLWFLLLPDEEDSYVISEEMFNSCSNQEALESMESTLTITKNKVLEAKKTRAEKLMPGTK
jgi:hypothetical protein